MTTTGGRSNGEDLRRQEQLAGSKSASKKAGLASWLAQHRPALIGECEFSEIAMKLAPISAGYLRRLLRDSGVPLAALVEGVVQGNFADLERTLLALAAEYMAAADAMRSRQCRDAVITAKDHTRWSLRRQGQPPEAQARREEMLLWMLTWLENPPAFADWLALRKRQLKGG